MVNADAALIDKIVERVLSYRSDLTREQVIALIEAKVKELEGLIDRDAAALLVAKELGVPLPRVYASIPSGRVRIKDLVPGLRGIKLLARVLRVPRPIELEGGKKILRISLGDESGVVDLIAWNEHAISLYEKLEPGDCVLISGLRVRKYKERLELGLGEGGHIELVEDDQGIPSLEELAKLHGINILVVEIHGVVESERGICIYGTHEGRPVQVLAPREIVTSRLETGKVIVLQDARPLSGDVPRYRLSKLSRIFSKGKREIAESPFKVLEVDDLESSDKSALIGIRGIYVASLPSRKGPGASVVIAGRKSSVSVALFDDGLALKMRDIKAGSCVELLGIYSSGHRLRLNPYSTFRVVADSWHVKEPIHEALAVKSGYIRCKATVTFCRVKYRLTELGEPLIGMILSVDDGTGWARLLVSGKEQVAQLVGGGWDEIQELAAVGALPKMAAFLEEWLRGVDVEIEGWLCEDRTLAAVKLNV